MWHADDPTEQEMELGQRLEPGTKITEPIFIQHKAVMLSLGYLQRLNDDRWKLLESADDLVETVGRVFSPNIERIILDSWCGPHDVFSDIYWEHTARTFQFQHIQPTFVNDSSHDPSIVYMTPDRTVHVREELGHTNEANLMQLVYHLLKFHEILDAAKERLPRLRSLEIKMHTYARDRSIRDDVYFPTSIKATVKEGGLWVHWDDVDFSLGKHHHFVERWRLGGNGGGNYEYGVGSFLSY
ncbi:hypothetical protein P171DRAFT_886 [Karstenula rhodostoma CBS 690.94]|uniref:Uncharacterized protein n=1 Tax=Karstenula rhodostoma CBS 690.94 TaxID=1392251 RepID=A0A9P4PXU7_9PLEO|nr:hypothetical protein P171DRAFT_886 [Karstenula rhodostoma CBS 690.94]